MKNNGDTPKLKKLSKSEIVSILIYTSYVLVSIAIWFTKMPLYDILYKQWIITYLVLLYNLFIDETPPKLLDFNGLITKKEDDQYYEDYLESVINLLSITMRSIRYIDRKKYNNSIKEEYMHNLKVVQVSYVRLKNMKVPNKYIKAQANILIDVERFIDEYEDYYNL